MKLEGTHAIVTGGAGFLGSHLVRELLRRGAIVTVVDMPSANTINIGDILDSVNYVKCDISDNDDVKKLPDTVDVIFHLAAVADPRLCESNSELAFKVNVQGTFNMLNYATRKNVKKFIFPSAAALYGKYPRYIPIDENHPIDPSDSVYITTKRFGEILCDMFYQKYGLPVLYFRLFNTYGERQGPGYLFTTIILDAIKKGSVELWNDKPVRDFTYVSDIIDAFIRGVDTKYCGGPINLGSGREISIGEIAQKIVSKVKELESKNVDIHFLNKEVWGPMRLLCDNTKAQRLLNWSANTSLEDGIDKTVKWYVENKNLFK